VLDKPCNVDPLAESILAELVDRREAGEIVLGGYVALQHYTDYRTTHDLDAWWRTKSSPATERVIRAAMQKIAAGQGYELRERRFGETSSFELRRDGKKRFSFQIAVRAVELEPPVASAWPPILIETLPDNIGGKMNALVERGAARDFLDVKHIVTSGLATPAQCWALWQRKNPAEEVPAGRSKVLFQLAALGLRRPLDSIADPRDRDVARATRQWFRREFLGANA